MKISLWIPAIVLYAVRVAFSTPVHVGTVLFTTTDLVKKCWTESDKSLLRARLVMQDVLPDPDCIDFSNPNAVVILLDYFHSCFQIISTSTYGRIQNLMYLALADALGGYLRAYVLPFTRTAFYAGQVKYSEAKKLFQLYDDIRVFLKTNGVGWVEPQRVCVPNFHVKPLVITGGALEACKDLYIIEKKERLHSMNTHSKRRKERLKKSLDDVPLQEVNLGRFHASSKFRRKREGCEEYNFCNASTNYNGSEPIFQNLVKALENATECFVCGRNQTEDRCQNEEKDQQNRLNDQKKRVIVPLPILDDCEYPHSIAVPFKKQPFRSLTADDSAFILEYYYLAVIKCFIAKGNSRSDIKNFNGQFHNWLTSQVIPHLCEEQWYPAFGGVFRIVQTIRKFGVESSGKDTDTQDIAFLFSDGAEFADRDEFQKSTGHKVSDAAMSELGLDVPDSTRHVVIAVIVASLFWLFTFCAVAFFFQAKRSSKVTTHRGICSPSRTECQYPPKQQQCKNLNFQFLIKFFKRKDGCNDQVKPSPKECPVSCKSKQETKCLPKPRDCLHGRKVCSHKGSACERRKSCNHPVEAHLVTLEKLGIFGDEVKHKNRGQGDQLQMLWKKPSSQHRVVFKEGHEGRTKRSRFDSMLSGLVSTDKSELTSSYVCSRCKEDESRDYTTEKQSTTSYSRESLQTQTTTTSTEGSTEELECESTSSTADEY